MCCCWSESVFIWCKWVSFCHQSEILTGLTKDCSVSIAVSIWHRCEWYISQCCVLFACVLSFETMSQVCKTCSSNGQKLQYRCVIIICIFSKIFYCIYIHSHFAFLHVSLQSCLSVQSRSSVWLDWGPICKSDSWVIRDMLSQCSVTIWLRCPKISAGSIASPASRRLHKS